MEHHGPNFPKNVIAVIPARYSSTRLPGKLLCMIAGKPLVVHTLERARAARNIDRVIVATDDDRIVRAVGDAGGEAVLTSAGHASGSDRVAEVAAGLPPGAIIVNVQGDEPMIAPSTIEAAVEAIVADETADIVTTSEPIADVDELMNGNVVKVVTDAAGFALYFSRSPVPYPRDVLNGHRTPYEALRGAPQALTMFRKHTGLYVYRREYLLRFTSLPPSRLEQIEMLEQLRALEDGARIKVIEIAESSVGVDTETDLDRVRALIEANG